MAWLIIACEVGFWVLLALGLVARYGFGLKRTSAVLLVSVPAVDLVLLGATVVDLSRGAVATWVHGLAAVYLGFSVAFGHRTIARVDQWVAHRYAGGPAPAPVPRSGPLARAARWASWFRAVQAWLIACALLLTAIVVVNDSSRTGELLDWVGWLTGGLLLWLLAGPLLPRSSTGAKRAARP